MLLPDIEGPKEPQIDRGKTVQEVGVTFLKGAVPVAAALVLNEAIPAALQSVGVEATPLEWQDFQEILFGFPEQGAFLFGMGLGFAENFVAFRATLDMLQGKIREGTYAPVEELADGTLRFQITCIDGRRVNRSGGAVPGGFALFGAEPNSVILAAMAGKSLPESWATSFAVGYLSSRNLLTASIVHIETIKELMVIAGRYPDRRILVEIEDHLEGCGAEGFTNLASLWTKFVAHNPNLADMLAIPNEVAGYSYTNMLVAPIVAVLSGGRVSVRAVTRRTELGQAH
ncbi:MAG: hypothetical protein HYS86_01680 [Candidatus Chisholmbacteria bacterium]|nr:hypothetical protein [Candidatus Chisholmbacteria bacterium]